MEGVGPTGPLPTSGPLPEERTSPTGSRQRENPRPHHEREEHHMHNPEHEEFVAAKMQAGRLMMQANMMLFEARDLLEAYTNGSFGTEISAIQERLRDATGAVNNLTMRR